MKSRGSALGGRAAFSLMEMLLVLALIGLFLGTILLNVVSMFRGSVMDELEGTLWIAIDKAKQNAVFQQRRVALSFDEERLALVLSSGDRRELYELAEQEGGEEIRVLFNERLPENARYLVSGRIVDEREIERVVFFPDGTCTPFLVSVEYGELRNSFEIDPWTGNQIVPEVKAL